MNNQSVGDPRSAWGNGLIRFCGYALLLSSVVKFWHPPRAMAYMASMGYQGGTVFFIAGLEAMTSILFLLPSTRRLGLLLLSAYLGGAIAAHLSIHRLVTGGPFLVFMATHRYIGAIEPTIVLLPAWIGMWLRSRQITVNDSGHKISRAELRTSSSNLQSA